MAKELTVAEIVKAAGQGDHEFLGYINGAGKGVAAANALLDIAGKDKLYCQPENLPEYERSFLGIIETFLKKHPNIADMSADGFATVLATAMVEAFPCK